MIKFIKIVSISILFLMLTSTICFATDINMNLQSENSYSNSYNDSNNTHTTVPGQSLNNFSTQESDELTTSDIIKELKEQNALTYEEYNNINMQAEFCKLLIEWSYKHE